MDVRRRLPSGSNESLGCCADVRWPVVSNVFNTECFAVVVVQFVYVPPQALPNFKTPLPTCSTFCRILKPYPILSSIVLSRLRTLLLSDSSTCASTSDSEMPARERWYKVVEEELDDGGGALTKSGKRIGKEATMTSRAFLRVSLSLHATRMAAKATCCGTIKERGKFRTSSAFVVKTVIELT